MAKKSNKLTVELTCAQWSALSHVLNECRDKLAWDKDCKCYMDGGDILIAMDKSEYMALKSIQL